MALVAVSMGGTLKGTWYITLINYDFPSNESGEAGLQPSGHQEVTAEEGRLDTLPSPPHRTVAGEGTGGGFAQYCQIFFYCSYHFIITDFDDRKMNLGGREPFCGFDSR